MGIGSVMVVMIVLSSLGVNIGPLIAGAGVLGLAIGFGAQTLVKDVISGFFFLLDDAFRMGEYVEIDAIRGSVELLEGGQGPGTTFRVRLPVDPQACPHT